MLQIKISILNQLKNKISDTELYNKISIVL